VKFSVFHIILALLLAAIAGCLGAIAAGQWSGDVARGGGLHVFVHEELGLTAEQDEQLEQLEADFADERSALESALRSANRDLAEAMEEEHSYGPKVAAAIDEVHVQMGELQKTTVRHVFAMRELLDEEQRVKFDRQVSASLTGDPRE
jgi:Spy/CpxP family protein refolding chaperone